MSAILFSCWRTRFRSPATSCSFAFLNAVPLSLVSVTQPLRSAALSSRADGQHVIGVPRQAAREIRRFDAMLRRAVVLHRPDQRRP
jgi:predicted protein tyrosine phosphatase